MLPALCFTARRNDHLHCTPDARVAFITGYVCVSRLSQKRRGISSYPAGPGNYSINWQCAYATIVPILHNVDLAATFFIPTIIITAIPPLPSMPLPIDLAKKHHEWSILRDTFRCGPRFERKLKRIHAILECDKSRASTPSIFHPGERNGPDRTRSNTEGSRKKRRTEK